jgi:hypothetical protein
MVPAPKHHHPLPPRSSGRKDTPTAVGGQQPTPGIGGERSVAAARPPSQEEDGRRSRSPSSGSEGHFRKEATSARVSDGNFPYFEDDEDRLKQGAGGLVVTPFCSDGTEEDRGGGEQPVPKFDNIGGGAFDWLERNPKLPGRRFPVKRHTRAATQKTDYPQHILPPALLLQAQLYLEDVVLDLTLDAIEKVQGYRCVCVLCV